jgi:hypothetical protein
VLDDVLYRKPTQSGAAASHARIQSATVTFDCVPSVIAVVETAIEFAVYEYELVVIPTVFFQKLAGWIHFGNLYHMDDGSPRSLTNRAYRETNRHTMTYRAIANTTLTIIPLRESILDDVVFDDIITNLTKKNPTRK